MDTKPERLITSQLNKREDSFDASLRPERFEDFPGQERVKERLKIFVEAAKNRGDALGHLLLSGPPGLGKTTLAYIIANTRETNIKSTSAPVIEKPGDLAGLLTGIQDGDILFIDEIHRLPLVIEEYLYSAMEDFVIDIMIDQGPGARSVRLNLPRFTLIGATTRQGTISAPLRSRFNMACRLDYYQPDDLSKILNRSASILAVDAEEEGRWEIARRSRGTPRIANNLLRWVRDYSQVRGSGTVDAQTAQAALEMMDIDDAGLDEMDNRILEVILYNFNGGPVGLKTIAVAVGEEMATIEDVYEPFLIQEGYLMRTAQGRVATDKAARRFGLDTVPGKRKNGNSDQPSLL
jgi:Holliday junction DNA helicase RuvB